MEKEFYLGVEERDTRKGDTVPMRKIEQLFFLLVTYCNIPNPEKLVNI